MAVSVAAGCDVAIPDLPFFLHPFGVKRTVAVEFWSAGAGDLHQSCLGRALHGRRLVFQETDHRASQRQPLARLELRGLENRAESGGLPPTEIAVLGRGDDAPVALFQESPGARGHLVGNLMPVLLDLLPYGLDATLATLGDVGKHGPFRGDFLAESISPALDAILVWCAGRHVATDVV